MRILNSLVLVLLIGSIVSATESDHTILYMRSGAPLNAKWSLLQPAEESVEVTFTLALKQQNLDLLEELFWDDSNPDSPNFGQHLTRDEVRAIVSAPQEVRDDIMEWITETAKANKMQDDIVSVWDFGDAIQVRATVALVKKLFRTDMWLFLNEKNNAAVVKHMGPLSVPTEFVQHIDIITGITELPPAEIPFLGSMVEQRPTQFADDNQCNTPYTIKKLYGIPENLTITNLDANQSIYAEDSIGNPEGFGIGSLSYWEHANNLPPNPIKCILGNGQGNFYPNDTDIEAQLDTQMMTGMAAGAKTCFYIMDYGDAWMYEFSLTVFNTTNAPWVISMSYGWWEAEQCINETEGLVFLSNCTALHIPNTLTYIHRTNVEFMKLGLVGHTLLAASGDDGTAGTHGSMDNCELMNPIYPAASPFVLAVGATSVEPSASASEGSENLPPICTDYNTYQCNCSTSTNEQVCSQNNTGGFDTGGGFSQYSGIPSYQKQAVQGYVNSGVHLPSQSLGWSPNNRGFPDVAAVGENVCVLDPDTPCSLIGGTSAACPLWGSIITLLNQDRMNAGKGPLGFVNPTIYKMFYTNQALYFNDQLTTGNNGGDCGYEAGFNAAKGWDPLTGCGSPKFPEIRKFFATLP